MSEPDAFEGGDEPVLDPDRIAVTSHPDADEADLIEQFLEVPDDPEDPEEATDR